MALGLILALGIISMIVNGGVLLTRSLGLLDNQSITQGDTPDTYNKEYSESLEDMNINFNVGDLIPNYSQTQIVRENASKKD